MKILLYRYGSICEPDIIYAFSQFGFEVRQIDTEITNKNITEIDAINQVSKYLMDYPADIVFSINFYPFLSEVCNIFHIPYLCWIVDSPVLELYSKAIKNPYNRIFLFDRAIYDEIHPLNSDCVFHLPLAVNVEDKQKVIRMASASDRKRFSADISFVGSLYTEKCAYDRLPSTDRMLNGYLDGLMAAQLKIYGYYFIEECLSEDMVERFKKVFPNFYKDPEKIYLSDRATLAQLYIGNKISALERVEVMRRLSEKFNVSLYTASNTASLPKVHNLGLAQTLTEMPIIFNQSQINLNMTSKAIRSGIPLRIFDILGCEGFVLSNYQNEIVELFEPGVDLDVYSSMEDLEEKAAYYMARPALCKEIAHNAFVKAKELHNYPLRLTQMFELAFQKKEDV